MSHRLRGGKRTRFVGERQRPENRVRRFPVEKGGSDRHQRRISQYWFSGEEPLSRLPPCPLRGTSPARGGRTTRAYHRATYERKCLAELCCAPACGGKVVPTGTKGGKPPQAAFILAPQAPTTTLTAEGRVKPLNPLHLLNPHARQGVSIQAPEGCNPFHRSRGPPSPIDGGGKF